MLLREIKPLTDAKKSVSPDRLFRAPVESFFAQSSIFLKASCPCGGGCPTCQAKAKLNISQPNDPAEVEADQIADRVMRISVDGDAKRKNAKSQLSNSFESSNKIQRKCSACQEEDEDEQTATVRRKEAFASVAPTPPPNDAPPCIRNVMNSGGRPLDLETRNFFEPRLGADLRHVRIHTDSAANQSARSFSAKAYTIGSSIVFDQGQYSPNSEGGKQLLAHELAHTLQSRTTPFRIARDPLPVAAPSREQMVDEAALWLAALARQVEAIREMAAIALATTPGSAAGPRAFHRYLNQEILERLLNNAISVFNAQKSDNPIVNFPSESPEQTRLGEAYARAIEQLGLAMEEARVNAANLAPDVRETQERIYGSNRLRWMDANPAAPLAAGIRDTFTQAELDMSSRRHQQVATEFANLAANLHLFNLAGDGARRLRLALLNSSYQLVRDPASGTVRAQPDAALAAGIQPILDQLDGIDWAISQAVSRLTRAETRTRAFAADPISNATVGDVLSAHFSTRDPGYATLLADRLARMARELRGQGSLFVHARNPQDPSCTIGNVGGGLSMTAAHAEPNNFYFCRAITVGDDEDVSTVIHETVHATIPVLGSIGALTAASDTPRDRSYAFERIYSHLTTEEALDNAESYAFYVDALLGVQVQRPAAPQDQITGCTATATVSSAIARSTYRIRLGAMWAEQTISQFRGQTLPQGIIDVIQHGFPGADEARSREILLHLSNLAGTLQYYLPVTCRPATDAEARAGALVYSRSNRVTASGLSATTVRRSGDTIYICPDWLTSDVAVREDSLTSILILRYRSLVPTADVGGIVILVRFIQEEAQPTPTGRTLREHEAADVAARSP